MLVGSDAGEDAPLLEKLSGNVFLEVKDIARFPPMTLFPAKENMVWMPREILALDVLKELEDGLWLAWILRNLPESSWTPFVVAAVFS